jgi:primosomal protein N' (replication factor Y)
MPMIAEVVLHKVVSKIDRIYHYKIPEDLLGKLKIGHQVVVPFGFRKELGYVVGIRKESEYKNLKYIERLRSPYLLFTEEEIELARWLSEYYICFFSTALKIILPPVFARPQETRVGQESNRERRKELSFNESVMEKELSPVLAAINETRNDVFLLHQTIFAKKIEFYLQLILFSLQKNKSVLIVAPEIFKVKEIGSIVQKELNVQPNIWHSYISEKEKFSIWQRVKQNPGQVVIGTRSSIFLPIKDPGIIMIDEEFDPSYKQEKNPKYNLKTVALHLSEKKKIPLVFEGFFPSIESFYFAEEKSHMSLSFPTDKKSLPLIEIVDMRKEKDKIISKRLKEAVGESLSKKEKVVLFINRRGFFTYAMCQTCGHIIKCPNCSTPIIFDQKEKSLKCLKCDFATTAPIVCPKCFNASIFYGGAGSQRVEKKIKDYFPQSSLLRYDSDVEKDIGKGAKFLNKDFDILIGTQILTRTLPYIHGKLLGIVNIDYLLNFPNFRSAEIVFQKMCKILGLSSGKDLPQKAIIQTYHPDHYLFKYLKDYDYRGFFQEEIELRKALNYPPFSRLISVVVSGKEETKVIQVAEKLAKFLRMQVTVLGPTKAYMGKIRQLHRFRIFLKGENTELLRETLVDALEKVVLLNGVKLQIDVDPLDVL